MTASCFAHRNISSCTPATLLLPLCGNSIYSHLFLLRKLCFYFFLRSAEVSGPDKQDRCSQRDYRVEFRNSRSSARFLSRCKKQSTHKTSEKNKQTIYKLQKGTSDCLPVCLSLISLLSSLSSSLKSCCICPFSCPSNTERKTHLILKNLISSTSN